jgi:hypothetical protein
MMRFHKILPAIPLALAAAGCDGLSGPGTTGELGQGTFSYQCALSEGDAVCNDAFPDPVNRNTVSADLGIDGQVPAGIAVGGRFDLTYFGDVTTEDYERLTIVVEPAASDNVDEQGGFRIRAPGRYAFMARDRAERVVADFTYIDAYLMSDLKIWMDEQPLEEVVMQIGTTSTHAILGATPVADVDGVDLHLAGAMPYEWESSDPTILAIDPAHSTDPEPVTNIELNNDEVRITAVAPGTATLTVKVGGFIKAMAVTVTQEVTP